MKTKTTAPKPRLFVVKAKKAGMVVKQVLTSQDQAERWKALVKKNGYEVIA